MDLFGNVSRHNGSGLPFCDLCEGTGPPPANYKYYNLLMTGILLPLIGLFGLLGNSVSAFIYTRPHMQSSMNLYLSALAVSDICVIITAFFLFFMEGMRRYDPGISYVFASGTPFFFPSGLAAQTCSVYFTVAAAIDCFIEVVFPKRYSIRFCTKSRAIIVIAVIVILGIGYNVPHCFEVNVLPCWHEGFNLESLQVCPTAFRLGDGYITFYYVYLYTIIMAAGPLAVLIILNIFIIGMTLYTKRRKRRDRILQMRDLDSGGDSGQQEEESTDVVTLVLVVCLFIFCNSLGLIINFLEQSFSETLGATLNYLVDISNLLVVCNSSVNFIFYYAFGESFRKTLRDYFRPRPSRDPTHIDSQSKENHAAKEAINHLKGNKRNSDQSSLLKQTHFDGTDDGVLSNCFSDSNNSSTKTANGSASTGNGIRSNPLATMDEQCKPTRNFGASHTSNESIDAPALVHSKPSVLDHRSGTRLDQRVSYDPGEDSYETFANPNLSVRTHLV